MYENINDLDMSTEYKEKIREKVNSQYGINDCQGIVFHENSHLAKNIAKSSAVDAFIKENISDLSSGKTVKDKSLEFKIYEGRNEWSALGFADVLDAKIEGKYLEMTVLDTYDFNKDAWDPLVIAGKSLQENGCLTPF